MAKEPTFADRFGREPTTLVRSPGRVNLIGEHTDYNQGYSLPIAVDRYTKLAAAPNSDHKLRVYSEIADESVEVDLGGYTGLLGENTNWGNYVRGAARWMQEHQYAPEGADILLWGDLAAGTDFSAPSSLLMGLLATLSSLSGWNIPPTEMARAAREIETDFVGVAGTIVGPLTVAMAEARHALLVDCRSLNTTDVPLNLEAHGLSLAVVNSGMSRDLGDTGYAKRRRECEEAVGALRVITYNLELQSLRDVDAKMLASHGSKLYPTLYKRARHVVSENERVLQAMSAFSVGDVETVGELMNESHQSLRHDMEVSSPFIDRLVELARAQDGVLGAKLTGEGFGGSTINLVRTEAIRDFDRQVVRRYAEETSLPAEMHLVRAVGGLEVERL